VKTREALKKNDKRLRPKMLRISALMGTFSRQLAIVDDGARQTLLMKQQLSSKGQRGSRSQEI